MAKGIREKNKNLRYQSIVSTAERLFLDQGLDSVQMQDIADAAGIGIATLFRYFPKKDKLIVAVAIQNLERTMEGIEKITGQTKSAYNRIEDLLGFLLRSQHSDKNESYKFREAFESYASFTNEPLPGIEDYIDMQKQVTELLLPLIEDGKSDGSIRTDIPVDKVLMTIINAYGIFGNNVIFKQPITYTVKGLEPKIQQELLKEMLLSYIRPLN
ncbi:TetR/AcrR family transcriptional regulator [Bacillus sp. B-jedd]|uniref:TetR/AcrR family transcriptional regulator n=1 Tax=Bacillus sp. B-jedd TaxID=1476857 RepID=UPI00051564AF|nr:TetR/AcrR family transcriptional regulator [Bacillus sp. B-jedd]CEG28929.1 TetR family transcriptional regulator [Bacillus sp. B-jedd]